jgi:hypothetical protein
MTIMGRKRSTNAVTKPDIEFTCTEYGGDEDLHMLILEPLVAYINESVGKEIVTVNHEAVEKMTRIS